MRLRMYLISLSTGTVMALVVGNAELAIESLRAIE